MLFLAKLQNSSRKHIIINIFFLLTGFLLGVSYSNYDQMDLNRFKLIFHHDNKISAEADNFKKDDEILVKPGNKKQDDFNNLLKKNFPNQKGYFFNNIISCYEHSVIKGRDPSIIILASNNKTNTNCVARKLLKILTEDDLNKENLIIDSISLSSMSDDEAKEELDKSLVNIFENLNSKIALIENIEDLPAKSMILFHSYGDDESNAKFKGIMILFTFHFEVENSGYYFQNIKEMLNLIEQKLTEKLSISIHFDQLYPLYARIANNAVLINQEDNCQ
jgi:hypothetical protein